MAHQDEAVVTDRLRRALLHFSPLESFFLTAERKLKGLPAKEIEAFWAAPGGRVERHVRMTAEEVAEAFKAFSAAGLVASVGDWHLVTQAQRHLAEG